MFFPDVITTERLELKQLSSEHVALHDFFELFKAGERTEELLWYIPEAPFGTLKDAYDYIEAAIEVGYWRDGRIPRVVI